jgi:transcriptional regulator with XRE-family HTH domain
VELARRTDLSQYYLSRVESGQRGCNASAAERLAEVLEVDLQDLRTEHDAEEALDAGWPVARPKIVYRRVHQTYLKILLRAVGTAYAAMDEAEIEKHCEELSWEEVIEVVRARKQEIGFLNEVMQDMNASAGLVEEVRAFLEAVLEGYPDLDIRLLAAVRRRERSEEGRAVLTRKMRDLL